MIDKLGHQAGKLSANQLLSCVTDFWVCTSETFSLQWFLRWVTLSCRRTLQLARQLKDRAVEAQACYSLGNTYTLLQDYEKAIDYHLKHLVIAQELHDK